MSEQKNKKQKNIKGSNSLEPPKIISGFQRQPGQVGIHAPNSLDALRKRRPEERTQGTPFIGGFSEPQVSPQTYDCYNPIRKVDPLKKKSKKEKK